MKQLKVYSRAQRDELTHYLMNNGYKLIDWNYEHDLFENKETKEILEVLIIR
ncbi:MAG: hypothetical protein Q4A76_05265 [Porphyromonadaceae bacterium]|nr:hypothetical protein [Porphyromonadaceae bacterium]